MPFLTEPERCARRRIQLIAFCSAMLNCMCAGSLVLFSLWAPIFQDKLGFSQMQINGISIAGALGMYLPVPIFGAICDRYGPAKLSLLSALFFGPSYLLAAHALNNNLPAYVMLIAFVFIGSGTSSMYFAGVTTCAKNFTGNSRGIALALPIAAFGLSGLWEAQFVSRIFDVAGEIQIGRAFVFFAALLTVVGVIGGCSLSILPAELEKAGDEESEENGVAGERTSLLRGEAESGYGTDTQASPPVEEVNQEGWLNKETREFLWDHTMWWFAAGVFLTTGPGESFINNMGTLIRSLYTPDTTASSSSNPIILGRRVDPATHVSIIALTSTVARLIAGSLSDYLAPTVPVGPPPPRASHRGYLGLWTKITGTKPSVSRMYLLIGFALVMCLAQLFVAFGGVDQKGERFWLVSTAMGSGYGAVFTLAPTVVSVVWGVKNFGTNWGIITVTPAIGATLYGIIFAVNYDNAAKGQQHVAGMLGAYYHEVADSGEKLLGMMVDNNSSPPSTVCYGKECYDTAFMIMGASVGFACLCWVWAWRGWRQKLIVV